MYHRSDAVRRPQRVTKDAFQATASALCTLTMINVRSLERLAGADLYSNARLNEIRQRRTPAAQPRIINATIAIPSARLTLAHTQYRTENGLKAIILYCCSTNLVFLDSFATSYAWTPNVNIKVDGPFVEIVRSVILLTRLLTWSRILCRPDTVPVVQKLEHQN